ncbi:MAG: hypothetical protein ACI97A_003611 [Planctomycetota bacterium]|jgi:hypothetical protein
MSASYRHEMWIWICSKPNSWVSQFIPTVGPIFRLFGKYTDVDGFANRKGPVLVINHELTTEC